MWNREIIKWINQSINQQQSLQILDITFHVWDKQKHKHREAREKPVTGTINQTIPNDLFPLSHYVSVLVSLSSLSYIITLASRANATKKTRLMEYWLKAPLQFQLADWTPVSPEVGLQVFTADPAFALRSGVEQPLSDQKVHTHAPLAEAKAPYTPLTPLTEKHWMLPLLGVVIEGEPLPTVVPLQLVPE